MAHPVFSSQQTHVNVGLTEQQQQHIRVEILAWSCRSIQLPQLSHPIRSHSEEETGFLFKSQICTYIWIIYSTLLLKFLFGSKLKTLKGIILLCWGLDAIRTTKSENISVNLTTMCTVNTHNATQVSRVHYKLSRDALVVHCFVMSEVKSTEQQVHTRTSQQGSSVFIVYFFGFSTAACQLPYARNLARSLRGKIHSFVINKQLTHWILTACLRVHISYRTHPKAQISLQREGKQGEWEERAHTWTGRDKFWGRFTFIQ